MCMSGCGGTTSQATPIAQPVPVVNTVTSTGDRKIFFGKPKITR